MPSMTQEEIGEKFPAVYQSFKLQASLAERRFDEKFAFWERSGIQCFERWTVPYFMLRDQDKKRPCLRLNYPSDGKCQDCFNAVQTS